MLYENLLPENKQHINAIVNSYLSTPFESESVQLDKKETSYYSALELAEKRKTDRLVAHSLFTIREEALAKTRKETIELDVDTAIIELDLQDTYEKILSVQTSCRIYNLNYLLTQPDFDQYNELTPDDKSIIEMMFFARTSELTQPVVNALKSEDKQRFSEFSKREAETITRIADAYNKTSLDLNYIQLNDKDREFYESLGLDKKRETDRLIAFQRIELLNTKKEEIANFEDIETDELEIKEIN